MAIYVYDVILNHGAVGCACGFLILGINVEKILPWMDQSIIFRMVGKLKFLRVL